MSVPPENARTFIKRSTINTTLARITRLHDNPNALAKLTLPPQFMRIHRDARRSIRDDVIEFTLFDKPPCSREQKACSLV